MERSRAKGQKSKRGRQGNCRKILYMDASSSRRGKHKLADGWQFGDGRAVFIGLS
jgi:hypothetical protein